jgi:alpha-methylacyl-CoA racemase
VCADGKEISVGPLEPQFFAELLEKVGAPQEWRTTQTDQRNWKHRSARLAAIFRSRSSEEWCRLLEGSDVCFAPVLPLGDAPEHPHMKARGSYVEYDGCLQAAPAPRFSRTPGAIRRARSGADVLASWRQR